MITVLILVLHVTHLSSTFLNNAGWLQLARAYSSWATRETWARGALSLFQKAYFVDRSNYSSLLGAGMGYVIVDNEAAALSSWERAEISPQVLIGLGDQAKAEKRWNEALLYYRGATRLVLYELKKKGEFLAAGICQLTFAKPHMLNQRNQDYCQHYFSQNADNLMINGQFDGGNMWGWSKRYFSSPVSAVYEVDRRRGNPAPAASITGLTADYHGGLFQEITLPPGITVRYIARVKIQKAGEINVRLLYFGGRREGMPMGSAVQTISRDIDWTYLERTFEVPDADENLLRFFPALLTGRGTVWIDDVQLELELVSDN